LSGFTQLSGIDVAEGMAAGPTSKSSTALRGHMTAKLHNHLTSYCTSAFTFGTLRKGLFGIAATAAAGVALGTWTPAAAQSTVRPASDKQCTGSGHVWWSELLAPETDKLTDFYTKVRGWTKKVVDVEDQSEPPSSPDDKYTIFLAADQEVAGMMKPSHPEAAHTASGWFTYIQVADVDASAVAAKASGGTVLKPPSDVTDTTRIAIVSDPLGNVFGLVTSTSKGPC